MTGKHYPELDGLRAIAVVLVVMFHCRFIVMPGTFLQNLYFQVIQSGWLGVDLFFVLSGFLITGILLDTCGHQRYFVSFYQRRILRIFPLYYAALALTALAAVIFPNIAAIHQSHLLGEISYWFHFQNLLGVWDINSTPMLGHFWSLAVEEQFYLVWPLLVLLTARSNRLGKLILSLWVAAMVFRVIGIAIGREQNLIYLTITRTDALLLGAYVAVLFKQHGSLESLRAPALQLAAISAVMILTLSVTMYRFYASDRAVLLIGFPLLAMLLASIVVIALTGDASAPLRRMLRNPALRTIGKISFGIYLVHPLVKELLMYSRWVPVGNFWVAQVVFASLVIGISTAFAWLSYRYFEQRFLKLKPGYGVLKADPSQSAGYLGSS